MQFKTFTTRIGGFAIAILMAGSVAAQDLVCCGTGGDDEPGFDGPGDFAPPGIGGGDDDGDDNPIGGGGGGGTFIQGNQQLSQECDDAGGAYMRLRLCFDRDGNVINL